MDVLLSDSNYNPLANTDDGSCTSYPVNGCMDSNAVNYDINANIDNGSCVYCHSYGNSKFCWKQ